MLTQDQESFAKDVKENGEILIVQSPIEFHSGTGFGILTSLPVLKLKFGIWQCFGVS